MRGGWKKRSLPDGTDWEELKADYKYIYNNQKIQEIVGTQPLANFIDSQYQRYIGLCAEQRTLDLRKNDVCQTNQGLLPGSLAQNFSTPWCDNWRSKKTDAIAGMVCWIGEEEHQSTPHDGKLTSTGESPSTGTDVSGNFYRRWIRIGSASHICELIAPKLRVPHHRSIVDVHV